MERVTPLLLCTLIFCLFSYSSSTALFVEHKTPATGQLITSIEKELEPLLFQYNTTSEREELLALAQILLPKITFAIHLLMKEQHLYAFASEPYALLESKIKQLQKEHLKIFSQNQALFIVS